MPQNAGMTNRQTKKKRGAAVHLEPGAGILGRKESGDYCLPGEHDCELKNQLINDRDDAALWIGEGVETAGADVLLHGAHDVVHADIPEDQKTYREQPHAHHNEL